jgi:hypothetical protein
MTMGFKGALLFLKLYCKMPKELVVLSTRNYVGTSKYVVRLPKAHCFKAEATVSLYSIAIYNSSFNIQSEFNNNKFSIRWLGTTYDFVMPSGYYSLADFDKYIQSVCLEKGLYMHNPATNTPVYYLQVQENSVLYKSQINYNYIPTAADAIGLSKPASATWNFPNTRQTCQLILPSGSGLFSYFGLKESTDGTTFPATPLTTNGYQLSTTFPIISPVFAYNICCNLCHSELSANANLLFTLPLNNSYGKLISFQSQSLNAASIYYSSYDEISIQLFTQDGDLLQFADSEMTATLLIDY